MSDHSTRSPSSRKAAKGVKAGVKPSPDFPLNIHKGTGYWCKKVRGRVFYFGKVADDPKGTAALEQWLNDKDDLLAGKEPRVKTDGLTVEELCFRFLAHHEARRDNGEINPRTYQGLFATAATVGKTLGRTRVVVDLVPDDFRKLRAKLATTRKAPVAMRNEIQRVRSIFKFGFDDGLIPAPVQFGKGFEKPKLDAVRRAREEHRAEHGDRMFEAAEIRRILDKCGQPLKAMVLLAANGGFGQSDVSSLPLRAVDLDAGWIDFARVKTAIRRRIPLWPETIAAMTEWLTDRPKAKDPADAGLMFLTCRGARWVKLNEKGTPDDAVGKEFGKVLRELKLKRPGLSFYGMRHGFETIAGETADQVAVDAIMGHVPQGMSAAYRERVGDDRLRRIVEHVRAWLFPKKPDGGGIKLNGENTDPIDPSDPPTEIVDESGVDTRSESGVAISGLSTLENPANNRVGSIGPIGSIVRGPISIPASSPPLRLYVG